MKIIKLVAENVKRLHAVSITPDGHLVTIGGKNGAGKSSVLDSIAYAIGGERLVPSEPIRNGKSEAKVVVDLGDLVVTRRFTRDIVHGAACARTTHPQSAHPCSCAPSFSETTSTLTVTNQDGARYPSPQAMLDKLLGKLTFDPLAFARADPKEQDAILRRLVGLDVAPIEARRKAAFDQRAMLKKTHAIKAAQLAAMPFVQGVPAAEVPMEEIANEMLAADRLRKTAEEEERKIAVNENRLVNLNADLTRASERVETLERQLAEARAAVQPARKAITHETTMVVSQQGIAAAARAAVPDADAIRVKLKNTEVVNAAVRANRKHAEAAQETHTLAAQVAEMNEQVKLAEQDKVAALAAVRFPIKGLGLGDVGVTFNGLPFEQAADSEKVCTSVAIGIALNPQLRVLLIRNGNMLDKASLASVAAQAEAADMQVWVEMVAEDKNGIAVMMVDGEVAR